MLVECYPHARITTEMMREWLADARAKGWNTLPASKALMAR